MAENIYSGMRKLTLSVLNNTTKKRESYVFLGNLIGSDGLTIQSDTIEQTIDSFESSITRPVGITVKSGTISMLPYSIQDKGHMLPFGYDETSRTWNMFTASCQKGDTTLAFEKVCPNDDGSHGVNYIFRHVAVSSAHAVSIKRAATVKLDIKFYPSEAPASDYGITGDKATNNQYWQEYCGVYDPATDKVTFDTAPSDTETVTFDTQGGSAIDSASVKKNSAVTRPTDPTRDGYKFDDWYIAADGTSKYNFNSPVTNNITIYAHWVKA